MTSKRSSPGQRRRDLTPLIALLFLYPYIIGFSSDSTLAYSEISIGAGTGQYVYHDCSGTHTKKFNDAGISFTKKFEGPLRIGFGIGTYPHKKTSWNWIAVPDLALDWREFSIGTTGLRLGAEDNLYIDLRVGAHPPYASGSGIIRSGVGWTVRETSAKFWLGANVIPYNNSGLAAQIDFPVGERTFLYIDGRFGQDKQSRRNEFGVAAGIRLRN